MPEPTEKPSAEVTKPAQNGDKNAVKKPKPVPFIIVGIIVILGAIYGFKTWSFNQSHASTDDAQVVADSVDIAPQVAGIVGIVLIADNQLVKKGDLLISIDDRPFQSSLRQAQANLDQAIAAAQGAGVNVSLAEQTGSAQVTQAKGVVAQAQAGIATAQSDINRSQAGIASAKAMEGAARANVVAALSAVATAKAAVARAQAAVKTAQAVVVSATAQVKAADSAVINAQSTADVATKDAARYQSLVSKGAVSQQEADAKQAAADSANANLETVRQQADAARATLAGHEAEVVSARAAVTAAEAGVASAEANVTATRSQREGSNAGFTSAVVQQRTSVESVATARAKAEQAEGQLQQALTAGTTVDMNKQTKLQAMAKVEQARAAVEEAKLQLSYTKIYAPRDGRVTKKNVDVGQQLAIGTPILSLIDETNMWVVANYKETQMKGISVGKKVEIEIDAIPGQTFHGTVNSIQAETGAAGALLPPDNATGNFTKVVQRIPVKIFFDSGQKDLDQLRSGMSATAVVDVEGS